MKQENKLTWNLNDIWPPENFEQLLAETEKEAEATEKWFEKLNPMMEVKIFKEFIDYDQRLLEKFNRLAYLPELMESTNQKDSQARLMKTKVNDLILKYNQKSRKIGHWLKGLAVENIKVLDDVNAKRLFKAVPDLEYSLNYARLAAKYTLSQKEEEIVDNKDVNGSQVIGDLRALIEADFKYLMGKRKIKTQGELLKYVHSRSPKMRENAYRALFNIHKENIDKFFVIYQGVVKDWAYEAKTRGYESPISMRNFANHVPDKAVETLLKVCREERKIFWRYFEYKAKSLRKNLSTSFGKLRASSSRLNRFDLYAPKSSKVSQVIKLESAIKMVLESFRSFSPRFAEYGERVISEQHIDSHPKVNKRSGAFCATVGPKITPYVLLNHTNTLRDVATLAHELGHAIHSMYASHHYSGSQHANLPLSETASTLGEMILFEKIISTEKDPEVRKQMLWEKIADSYATILRQNYFVMFEIAAHKMISEGTTAKDLCDLYLRNLREQFGKAVVVEPIFKYEWLYISHIFESPFYCYAYNFGELLSLSLYARYKKEGKSFVPKIEKLLESGGSKDPVEVLNDIGIDMESEKFWRGGFEVIKNWQEELEKVI